MASLDFPTNPTNGQSYSLNGVTYTYNGTIGGWVTSTITNPTPFNANTTNTQVIYNDAGLANGSPGLVFYKAANTLVANTISVTNLTVNAINGPGVDNINLAFNTSNSASNTAVAAFAKVNSNAILQNVSGVTFGGDLFFSGNVNLGLSTASLRLPIGTTAQQPITITNSGQVRFNSSVNRSEEYVSGFWINNQNGYTNITGKIRTQFQYSGATATWSVPVGVTYIFVKMWGAGGGGGSYGGWRQGSTGGAGGYSEGILPVTAGQTVSMRVGQCGYARWGANKAYPDGGGASTGGGDNQYCGAAGGSTSIAVPSLNSGTWCMYAGGGGGGGCVNGFGRLPGGAGGGLQGEDGYPELTSYLAYAYVGKRGTQTAGGTAPSGASTVGGAGTANQGGTHQNANCYGGGGGGGYYGGSSGCYNGHMGGGGGGSGFIHSGVIRGLTLTGSREYPPMANDPDAIEYSVNGFRIGVGGDEGSNGGYGLIVIYY